MHALIESKVDRLDGRTAEAVARLEAARADLPERSYVGLFLALTIGQTHLEAGEEDGARQLVDDIRRTAQTLGTVWARTLCGLVELMVVDDIEAGRAGLAPRAGARAAAL